MFERPSGAPFTYLPKKYPFVPIVQPLVPMTILMNASINRSGDYFALGRRAASAFVYDNHAQVMIGSGGILFRPTMSQITRTPYSMFYELCEDLMFTSEIEEEVMAHPKPGLPHHLVMIAAGDSRFFSPDAPQGFIRYLITSPVDDTTNWYREFSPNGTYQTFTKDIPPGWMDSPHLFQARTAKEILSALETIAKGI